MENIKGQREVKFQATFKDKNGGKTVKNKHLQLVTVSNGVTNLISVKDKVNRERKGRKELKHTGDENWLATNNGVLYHPTTKIVKGICHKAKIGSW